MKKRLLLALLVTAAGGTVFGVGGGSAFQKEPDSAVDPASFSSVVTQLLAPAETLGDGDTTSMGTANGAVGITDSSAEPSSSSTGPDHTLYVDDTPLDADCPRVDYASIQAAVDASGPNDTIKVCPGTYDEQVRIVGHNHDGLKLVSLRPLAAKIQWPLVESFPLALVDFNTVDRVLVWGFTITGPFTFPACSPDRHEGLLVENAFDELIVRNHITKIQNSVPALYGCQEGDAVAIGRRTLGTQPGSARLEQNVIDEYQKNGVQIVNSHSSGDVEHNVITGSSAVQSITASNGVVVFRQGAATVEFNVVSNNKYTPFPLSTGISIAEAPPGSSEIDHNRVFGNDYGVETDTQNALEISHNDVFENLADGITVCGDAASGCGPATGIVVIKNDTEDNGGSGVALVGANANLIKANHVERNGTTATGPDTTDGIRVDASSTNNKILDNRVRANVTHDCHDDSTGPNPPSFVANLWRGNVGATENKPGLCTAPERGHEDDGDDDGD